MKRYTGLIVLALALASCGGKKEKGTAGKPAVLVVTDREKAGIKEATDFYGGSCNFSAPVEQPGNLRVARIEISGSPALEQAQKITELNLSNIALIFFRDLQDERKNFDQVQVQATFANGQKVERKYPASLLSVVIEKTPIQMKAVELIKDHKYNELANLLNDDNGITHFDKARLIHTIKATDSTVGQLQSFVPYGFIIIKSDNGKDILHMSGLMVRSKNNNEFSIDVNPYASKDEAIFINYKL